MSEVIPLAEVSSDGQVVWVNGPLGALARFGRNGIDVHTADTASCLYCTHTPTTADDWPVFVAKVAEHHGVVVDDSHRPHRFQEI